MYRTTRISVLFYIFTIFISELYCASQKKKMKKVVLLLILALCIIVAECKLDPISALEKKLIKKIQDEHSKTVAYVKKMFKDMINSAFKVFKFLKYLIILEKKKSKTWNHHCNRR